MSAARWADLEFAAPELAAAGRRLLYPDGDLGRGYLATTAPDGGPRVHPIFPLIDEGDLWMFIVDMSPKFRDLLRNGRFALHAWPAPGEGEEFALRGSAERVCDPAARARVVAASGGRQGTAPFEALFRCRLESVLHVVWANWGTEQAWPSYSKWRA